MKKNNLYDLQVTGNIVLLDKTVESGSVFIQNGKFVAIEERPISKAKKVLNFDNCWILPGVVDEHVHSRSEPTKDIDDSTKAAASGGVTTIIDMPYDSGAPVASGKIFRKKISMVNEKAVVDVALLATLPKFGGVEYIDELIDAGACGFKLSVFETDPNRFPRIPDGEILKIFSYLSHKNIRVGFHAEVEEIIKALVKDYEEKSPYDPLSHCKSRPPIAETAAVVHLLELAKECNVKLHFYHLSIPRSVYLIDLYREEGLDITAETCPHYLVLNQNDMKRLKGRGKINPPLRTQRDQEGLWMAVKAGKINTIASDHVAWPEFKKDKKNIFENSSGCPGVDLLLPLIYHFGVVEGKIDIYTLVKALSFSPSKLFGLDKTKGEIAVGKDADLVVIDPDKSFKIEGNKSFSGAGWSPYEGMELKGKIISTIVRGEIVYDGEKVVKNAGFGRFIRGRDRL